jgi:hypothetical protein
MLQGSIGADRHIQERFTDISADGGLDPLPVLSKETHSRDRSMADFGCDLRHIVESKIQLAIQDPKA